MDTFTKYKKNTELLVIAEGIVIIVLALLAIHDACSATGTGYYFYLKYNVPGRLFWDVLADAIIAAMAGVLTIVPVLVMKGSLSDSVLFFLANCAFTVYIRPDRIIFLFAGNDVPSRENAAVSMLGFLPRWLVIAVFLLLLSTAVRYKGSDVKIIPSLAVSAGCMAAGICLPILSGVMLFAAGYTSLLPLLKCCVITRNDNDMAGGRLLAGSVFFLCGMWRLIMVLATYHV